MRVRYPYLPIWIICGALAVMVGLCLRPGPVETPPLASEETLARLEAAGVSQEDVAHYPETVMKHLAWILEGRNIRQYQVAAWGGAAGSRGSGGPKAGTVWFWRGRIPILGFMTPWGISGRI